MNSIKHDYRPDIDGLRTIAVAAVVLFHLSVAGFPGGYFGVDIFFVISGYLIPLTIRSELASGTFTITRFYERRLRRIVPALSVTCLATFAAAYFIFMPDELRDLGPSLAAVTTFSSNVLFWMQTDYFAGPAEAKPLLHTWSLAVEEQFYIIMPLLLLLLSRYGTSWQKLCLCAVAAISFGLSCAWVFIDPSGNYYLPHTRAWELLFGTLIAYQVVPQFPPRYNNVLGVIGLILMVAPVFFLDSASVFPAWNAVPVCLGTALIIHTGSVRNSIAARVLSIFPLPQIGLISYSLYLVHWPLIVFTKYELLRDLQSLEKVLLGVSMLVLAWLSWRFVETPFRNRHRITKARIFQMSGVVAVVIATVGIVSFVTKGLPARFPNQESLASVDVEQKTQKTRCFLMSDQEEWEGEKCFLTARTGKVVLLWGDSHANHYRASIARADDSIDDAILFYGSGGCPPILDFDVPTRDYCRPNNSRVLNLIKEYDVRTVVLSAYWQRSSSEHKWSLHDLENTITTLRNNGVDVKIIGDNPDFPFSNPAYLAWRLASKGFEGDFYTSVRNDFKFNDRLESLVGATNFADPMKVLCKESECLAVRHGHLVMTDNAHFSRIGADIVLETLRKFF